MKKYLIASLICFSAFAIADAGRVGEIDSATHGNDCNAPQIAGCGPCYKLCVEQNKSDRVAKDTNSEVKKPKKTGSSSASKQ